MEKIIQLIVIVCFTSVTYSLEAQNQHIYKFDFGSGKVEKGFTQVLPSMVYNKKSGFGFDYGTTPNDVVQKANSPLTGDFVTSNKSFYFSVALPEGNYKVTVLMGNMGGESDNIVRAESRRLMVESCKTSSGKVEARVFTVNIRTPKISDTVSIKIKPREVGYLNWDEKLTLEFTGSKPCICSVVITKMENAVTVFLAGNSTVVDQDKEPWAAWGQMIPRFFKSEVCIANFAESGESLRSFKNSNRLKKVISLMKPGDYLFIEFGHNDQKQKGEGVGPWTSYKSLLKEFIDATRNRGGIPVLVTSMHRRNFDSTGHIINTLGEYPDAVRKTAEEEKVALIDLNAMSKTLYEAWGPEKSLKAFVHFPANSFPGQDKALADNTHFSTYGAYEIAKCILEGIKANNLGLVKYISEDYKGFDPAKPDQFEDWAWPLSPMVSNTKPDGN